MIDLPVGKALIAVYADKQCKQECREEDYQCPNYMDCCKGCEGDIDSKIGGCPDSDVCGCLCCIPEARRDGRHVVYKVVDYPEGNHASLM